MPRLSRRASSTDTYHVTMRGIGRRLIFESDEDRMRFLDNLRRNEESHDLAVLAWCLMDNHVHLLLRAPLKTLKVAMHSLGTSYANYFNARVGHVGPVFQGRYGSVPIESDEQALACLRYIHLNPVRAKIGKVDEYLWSSYREYLGEEGICETRILMEAIGSHTNFSRLHDPSFGEDHMVDLRFPRSRMPDEEAWKKASEALGKDFSERVPNQNRSDRDRAIRRLYAIGLSGRQIERFTGIGRGTIQRLIGETRKQ